MNTLKGLFLGYFGNAICYLETLLAMTTYTDTESPPPGWGQGSDG